MIILLPVSHADIDLLPHLARNIAKFGGLGDYGLFVFPSPSVETEARKICESISELAREYRVFPLLSEPTHGWPIGPNEHFRDVMEKWHKLGIAEPVLWLEPDCAVRSGDAFTTMLTEYNLSKKPYQGFVRRTAEVAPGLDGHHMVAAGGIFHPNFTSESTLWQYARPDQPFDIWMRWVTVGDYATKSHCHHTNLIRHLRRTINYRRNAQGQIVCDEMPPDKEPDKQMPTHILGDDAVFVHGCRDGSLHRLICGEEVQMPSPTAKTEKTEDGGDPGTNIDEKNLMLETTLGGEKLRRHHLAEKLEITVQALDEIMAHPNCEFEYHGPVKLVVKKKAAEVAA